MRSSSSVASAASDQMRSASPSTSLNFYELLDAEGLAWDVSTYLVQPIDPVTPDHEERGAIRDVIWKLRQEHKHLCRGYGFVIDINEDTVAIPASWALPSGLEYGGYYVRADHTFRAMSRDAEHRAIIAGIIREGLKSHFKRNPRSTQLGDLWQDYDKFCQMPNEVDHDCLFCRRISTVPKVLRGNRWGIEFVISTATLDGRAIADYYAKGEVRRLAQMVRAKQANRLTRRNQQTAVRVWWNQSTEYQMKAVVYDLDDPEEVLRHAELPRHLQAGMAQSTIRLRPFVGDPVDAPLGQLRLVLDTQITQEEHAETILEPGERSHLCRLTRDFVDGAEVFGHTLRLASSPVAISSFPTFIVAPPAVRVRGDHGHEVSIQSPEVVTEAALRERARNRSDEIKRNGFLQSRPINPLLVCPKFFGQERAKRLKSDLNTIWKSQGIEYRFERFELCESVQQIRRLIEQRGYDAVFAVLPEGSHEPQVHDNAHEQIKKQLDVPSQCILHDHTLPERWVLPGTPGLSDRDRKHMRRVIQRYELCLHNLLVKHNWVPFAPAEPFNYNVHIGLDVGGQHNTRAMACLGYGFRSPTKGLLFRPEPIPINVQKAEPIPTDCLYDGLLHLFEVVHAELIEVGQTPDFDSVLMYRDGQFLGEVDRWNEIDAIVRLQQTLSRRGWISSAALWTAVEVMKHAEGWRILRENGGVANPLVGTCVLAFDSDHEALVCTTGAPYLTQGTASPLKVRSIDVSGTSRFSDVLRDLVWQADMGFTKPDMGLGLPWVLHVADTGALQASRSYRITGITA